MGRRRQNVVQVELVGSVAHMIPQVPFPDHVVVLVDFHQIIEEQPLVLLAFKPFAVFGERAGNAAAGVGFLIALLFQADDDGVAVGHGAEGVRKHLLGLVVVLDVALEQVAVPVVPFKAARGTGKEHGLIGNADAADEIAVGHEMGEQTGEVVGLPGVDYFAFHVDEVGLVSEIGAEQIVTVAAQFLVVTMNAGGNAVYGHDLLLERLRILFGRSGRAMSANEAKCMPKMKKL